MTDIALIWDADRFAADIVLSGGQVATDDGMRTAILISLFSDARAPAGAELPEPGADPRGWWGDAFAADAGDGAGEIGSTLWLLRRAKNLPAKVEQARQAGERALAWLVRDGIAASVQVEAEARGQTLAIGVSTDRPSGPGRQRYDFTWDASTGDLIA